VFFLKAENVRRRRALTPGGSACRSRCPTSVKVVLRVGSPQARARTVAAATLSVAVVFAVAALMLIGAAGPSHSQLHPDSSPEAAVLSRLNRSGARKILDAGRENLARGFVSIGASLDQEAVYTYTPVKGYIRKALEKTRRMVEEQESERAALQDFYEKEIAKLQAQVQQESAVLEEVLGDDFSHIVPALVLGENVTKEELR